MYKSPISNGQLPSEAWLKSQFNLLRTLFASRNSEYRILRKVFDGQMSSAQEASTKVGTPFQDRINLTYNVNNATVRRYMDEMSQPPRIECQPEGFELADLELADKRTKFLEYIWDCNSMTVKLMQAAYYQSLLDKAIWHVRPAPYLPHKIRIELGVPDFYYPLTRGDDWQNPIAVFYGYRTAKSADEMRDPMKFDEGDVQITENLEYWDPTWFVQIKDGKWTVIRHDLGVIPWLETHNLPIPHRFRGQGDVDQAIGLNEYLNMLMSAMGTMIAYAAAPIAIVKGTKVGGTNLPFQPGAVWELERDAQAGFLQWSGAPPSFEAQMLRTLQAVEDTTGASSTAFGREIPSGTSGNAIRSLNAGFRSRTGTKQQLLGDSLSRLNEVVQLMAEKMFPDEVYRVVGENIRPGKPLGKKDMYTVKPKEFKGWYRNRIVFTPLDPAATYFQETDKYKQGLQSRYSTMKALGVQNVWDEIERIRIEHEEQAQRENDMALAKQGQYQKPISPEEQASQEQELQQIMSGLFRNTPEQKAQDKDTQTQALTQTSTGQLAGPTAPTEPQGVPEEVQEPINPDEALQALRQAQNLSGRGAMLGEKILLENPADEAAVRNALGPLAKRFKFDKIDPNNPLSPDAISFGSQKKNPVEMRRFETLIRVINLRTERTNNNALIFNMGILDEKGNTVPIGKTQAQRKIDVDEGEIFTVKIQGMSHKDGKWGLLMPTPVRTPSAPARPHSLKDIERMFGGNNA